MRLKKALYVGIVNTCSREDEGIDDPKWTFNKRELQDFIDYVVNNTTTLNNTRYSPIKNIMEDITRGQVKDILEDYETWKMGRTYDRCSECIEEYLNKDLSIIERMHIAFNKVDNPVIILMPLHLKLSYQHHLGGQMGVEEGICFNGVDVIATEMVNEIVVK